MYISAPSSTQRKNYSNILSTCSSSKTLDALLKSVICHRHRTMPWH